MKALTFRGKEKIAYETIPDPFLEADTDVIVEVDSCAICGSDLHPYYEREQGLDHGCAMGHEFTGRIVEVGKKVSKLQKGDKVMSPFTSCCGQCFYCRKGLSSRCEKGQLFGWRSGGQGLHGGQAELVRVPLADQTLLNIPEEVSDKLALLLGDILSTGYFCAHQAGIHPEEIQVVIGCGPVGLMSIWAARQMGAEKIYAIDSVPERLHRAQVWGATPINFKETSVVEIIRKATQGRGADAAMEAVGSESAVASAFELLRPGATLSSVGVCTAAHLPFSPTAAYDKNITYKIGRCPARHYMEKLIKPAMAHSQLLESVFTHNLPLADGARGYEIFARKQDDCQKVLLHCKS